MNQGVFINEQQGYLQFANTNPLAAVTSTSGAPVSDLLVSVNNGPMQSFPGTFIDSGGVYGTIPSDHAARRRRRCRRERTITVYNSDGTELYTYTTTTTNSPTVTTINSGAADEHRV